jgi:glycosyltransferase involved in cell wall biosynthesis
VHLGCSLRPSRSSLPTLPPATPFVLFVGDRGGYKNFDTLVRAMGTSRVLRDMPLVCFGGGPIRDKRVIHVSGGDDVLASLYTQAAALVYPSLYEGFGMPLLEAMACGCPVVCSNTASLPEIAGDAAELCDPSDPAHIAAAIENVLSPARATELRRLGAARVKEFTWEKCARETREVYRSLL